MFDHPVDVGVMLALTETVLFLFGMYDSNKAKNLQKNPLIEEGKEFSQSMGSLKQIPYICNLDLFSGISKVPGKVLLNKILPKLEIYGTQTEPLQYLLRTFVNLPNPSSNLDWNPGYELLAIHPLSTIVYESTYRDVLPSFIDSRKDSLKDRTTTIRYFSDVIVTLDNGSLYDDLQETVKIALEQLKLPYVKTLIGRGQSTNIFPFGEKKRTLALTKNGLLKIT